MFTTPFSDKGIGMMLRGGKVLDGASSSTVPAEGETETSDEVHGEDPPKVKEEFLGSAVMGSSESPVSAGDSRNLVITLVLPSVGPPVTLQICVPPSAFIYQGRPLDELSLHFLLPSNTGVFIHEGLIMSSGSLIPQHSPLSARSAHGQPSLSPLPITSHVSSGQDHMSHRGRSTSVSQLELPDLLLKLWGDRKQVNAALSATKDGVKYDGAVSGYTRFRTQVIDTLLLYALIPERSVVDTAFDDDSFTAPVMFDEGFYGFLCLFLDTTGKSLAEQLPPEVRYSGLALWRLLRTTASGSYLVHGYSLLQSLTTGGWSTTAETIHQLYARLSVNIQELSKVIDQPFNTKLITLLLLNALPVSMESVRNQILFSAKALSPADIITAVNEYVQFGNKGPSKPGVFSVTGKEKDTTIHCFRCDTHHIPGKCKSSNVECATCISAKDYAFVNKHTTLAHDRFFVYYNARKPRGSGNGKSRSRVPHDDSKEE
jgi:hypothetical protein